MRWTTRSTLSRGNILKKRYRLFGSLIALSFVAAACGSDKKATSGDHGERRHHGHRGHHRESPGGTTASTNGAGTAGGDITIALGSEPTSLDPYLVDDGAERAVNDNIYETLLTRTPTGELQPGLATALPTQVDDLTWQFKLRDGVTFHDGSPFNADSVVASINRMVKLIADKKTDNDGFYSSITGAAKVDDTTVNITTAKPDGVHAGADVLAEDDRRVRRDDRRPVRRAERHRARTSSSAARSAPTSSSPPTPTTGATRRRSPTSRYEFVAEGGTRLAGLKSGKYDLITNLPPQDVDQAPQAGQRAGPGDTRSSSSTPTRASPPTRTCASRSTWPSTSRQSSTRSSAATPAVEQGQLLSPSVLGFNDSLDAYPYDADKAKQMIKDAGVAGQTIQLVGEARPLVERPRPARGGRRLLERTPASKSKLDILEFGAYLDVLFDRDNRADAIYVSSSNDILDP